MGACCSTQTTVSALDSGQGLDVSRDAPGGAWALRVGGYNLGPEIGRGHFGVVRKCIDEKDVKTYAMKIVRNRTSRDEYRFQRELVALEVVGSHPHIVGLHNVFKKRKAFYFVFELARGGNLFEAVEAHGRFSEYETAVVMSQLGSAIKHCQDRGVVHRDLKPENVVLMTRNILDGVKIADFGLAKIVKRPDEVMTSKCGTWHYCAPEILLEKYTKSVDVWALGVLMFIMLGGYHPFDICGILTDDEVIQKIINLDYDFRDPVWNGISKAAKQLIAALLTTAEERISIEDFLQSPWILAHGRSPQAARVAYKNTESADSRANNASTAASTEPGHTGSDGPTESVSSTQHNHGGGNNKNNNNNGSKVIVVANGNGNHDDDKEGLVADEKSQKSDSKATTAKNAVPGVVDDDPRVGGPKLPAEGLASTPSICGSHGGEESVVSRGQLRQQTLDGMELKMSARRRNNAGSSKSSGAGPTFNYTEDFDRSQSPGSVPSQLGRHVRVRSGSHTYKRRNHGLNGRRSGPGASGDDHIASAVSSDTNGHSSRAVMSWHVNKQVVPR